MLIEQEGYNIIMTVLEDEAYFVGINPGHCNEPV